MKKINSGDIFKKEESNKNKNYFENIKSYYILKRIFNLLERHKLLGVMKNNKKLQKRLNLNINDYKKYSQIYTPIEIELKLVENEYDKFINISDKEAKYYHFYFDNSDKEIKRHYLEENEDVKTIKIIIDYQIKSFNRLFYYCKCINLLNFTKFNRTNIKDMSYMFNGCSSLKELNISLLKTNNVTNMSCMFFGCSSLRELNLSNFNTNKVKDMSGMFSICSSLKELNLSNFNTNNVTNMSCMFEKCLSLKELNLSSFNLLRAKNMSRIFSNCSNELIRKINPIDLKLKKFLNKFDTLNKFDIDI